MEKRGYMLQEFVAHELDVNCLSIGKKSNRVFLTGGEDCKVNLWSIGQTSPSLRLEGHTSGVESVAFDSGELLVLSGASDGAIRLWDLEESKIVRSVTGHRSSCTAVEFHPFGEFFASGSVQADLKIWDIRKKGCIHTYTGHSGAIRTVRFTPDGRWVVTGGDDHVVKIWDLTAGKLMHQFKYHSGPVNCLRFHPNEFLLATGSADKTVKFWDLETFEIIGSTGPEASGVSGMTFHPDGRTLFCGMDNALKVYSWEPVICHDVVDVGWANLADLTIYEGKLIALSFLQSRVSLWIADISLIGPYALGVLGRATDFGEPAYSLPPVKDEIVVKVKPPLLYPKEDLRSAKANKTPEQTIVDEEFVDALSSSGVSSPDRSASSKRDSKISKQSSSSPSVQNRSIASKFSKITSTSTSSSSPVARSKLSTSNNNNNTGISSSSVRKRVEECPPVKDIHEISSTSSSLLVSAREHQRRLQQQQQFQKEEEEEDDYPVKSTLPCLVSFNKDITSATGKGHDHHDDDVTHKLEKTLTLDNNDNNSNGHEKPSPSPSPLPCSTAEKVQQVKYVRGVAVPLGKTKSLVQRWENKDEQPPKQHHNPPPSLPLSKGPIKNEKEKEDSGLQLAVIDEDTLLCNALMQNHDVFINSLKSRLTKLQVVRHFLEKDGTKGAIDAVAKLPDHSVQVDLVSAFKEKVQTFNLELFSCLLPVLVGLLSSKTDRHIIVSMEMTMELIKIFRSVMQSTLSATSRVGVDVQAEQRLKRCKSCLNQLQKMQPLLPSLTLRGGEMGKLAQLLKLSLQNLQH